MSKCIFISGHGDLNLNEWNDYYKPKIDEAIVENHHFILGDFRGCDKMSHDYLLSVNYEKVFVYHMFTEPRYITPYACIGGFINDTERDETMTRSSHDDIAWVRNGRGKSGTALNLFRRKILNEGGNIKISKKEWRNS